MTTVTTEPRSWTAREAGPLAAALAVALTACGGDDGAATDAAVDARADAAIDAAPDAGGPARVLYLNRGGGTYTYASMVWDAVTDQQGYVERDVTAPPFPHGDAAWTAVRDCVASLFAPFRVDVVDVDPGAVDHVEVVVTTAPAVFGAPTGTASVAPYPAGCPLLERGLAVVFAGTFPAGDTREMCESAAAMAGLAYGLDWGLHCPDVMTWRSGCGAKAFRDVDATCGETTARECRCEGATQNSYRRLRDRLGLR